MKMPYSLKIQTQTKHVLYDSTWIAGVDYNRNGQAQDQQEADDSDALQQHDDIESKGENDDGTKEEDRLHIDMDKLSVQINESNPVKVEQQQDNDNSDNESNQSQESQEQPTRQWDTRARRPPQRLVLSLQGKSYASTNAYQDCQSDSDPDETDTTSPPALPYHLICQVNMNELEYGDKDDVCVYATIIKEFNEAVEFPGVHKFH